MRLEDHHLDEVVEKIASFAGSKLTWTTVEDISFEVTGHRFTRVALAMHEAIKKTYATKKDLLRSNSRSGKKETKVRKLDEKSALRAKVAVLQEALDRANDRFHRWSYNAYQRGLTLEVLDREPPEPSRLKRAASSETLEACDREHDRRVERQANRRKRLKHAKSANRQLN